MSIYCLIGLGKMAKKLKEGDYMKDGMKYIKKLNSQEMYEFLRKCTSDFEYCPIPGMDNIALYNNSCEKQGKAKNGKTPGSWGHIEGVGGELCDKCVKEWLGIVEKDE